MPRFSCPHCPEYFAKHSILNTHIHYVHHPLRAQLPPAPAPEERVHRGSSGYYANIKATHRQETQPEQISQADPASHMSQRVKANQAYQPKKANRASESEGRELNGGAGNKTSERKGPTESIAHPSLGGFSSYAYTLFIAADILSQSAIKWLSRSHRSISSTRKSTEGERGDGAERSEGGKGGKPDHVSRGFETDKINYPFQLKYVANYFTRFLRQFVSS